MTAPALVPPPVDIDGARDLTDRIRAALEPVADLLCAAWERRVWIPLGHASWDAYLDAEFGDLLKVRLPVAERRARVVEMRSRGMSTRAIAPALGVSPATIKADLKTPEVVEHVRLAQVVSLDDRRRPATRPVDEPTAPPPSTVDHVVAVVARAHEGLIVHEVARRLRWRQGQASCALSRAEKRGRLVRSGRFRDGCAVYVVPEAP